MKNERVFGSVKYGGTSWSFCQILYAWNSVSSGCKCYMPRLSLHDVPIKTCGWLDFTCNFGRLGWLPWWLKLDVLFHVIRLVLVYEIAFSHELGLVIAKWVCYNLVWWCFLTLLWLSFYCERVYGWYNWSSRDYLDFLTFLGIIPIFLLQGHRLVLILENIIAVLFHLTLFWEYLTSGVKILDFVKF